MWNPNGINLTGSFGVSGGNRSTGTGVSDRISSSGMPLSLSPFPQQAPFLGLGGIPNLTTPSGRAAKRRNSQRLSGGGGSFVNDDGNDENVDCSLDLPIPDDLLKLVQDFEEAMNSQIATMQEVDAILKAREEDTDTLQQFNMIKRDIRDTQMKVHTLEVGILKAECNLNFLKERSTHHGSFLEKLKWFLNARAINSVNPHQFQNYLFEPLMTELVNVKERTLTLNEELEKVLEIADVKDEPPRTIGDVVRVFEVTKESVKVLAAEVQSILEAMDKVCLNVYGEKMNAVIQAKKCNK